jgi:hypothetical protein
MYMHMYTYIHIHIHLSLLQQYTWVLLIYMNKCISYLITTYISSLDYRTLILFNILVIGLGYNHVSQYIYLLKLEAYT